MDRVLGIKLEGGGYPFTDGAIVVFGNKCFPLGACKCRITYAQCIILVFIITFMQQLSYWFHISIILRNINIALTK